MNLDTPVSSFLFKHLTCELCKTFYPIYINDLDKDEKVPLAEVPQVTGPFIVLHRLDRESRGSGRGGLHVISLAGSKTMTFGRGHESDVRVPDVSISRRHAQIRYQDGHFYIEDLKSKFGTLICTKKQRTLNSAHATSIQVGRTVLKLTLQAEGANSMVGESFSGAPTSVGAVSTAEQELQSESQDC
jgi:hypothetical protein